MLNQQSAQIETTQNRMKKLLIITCSIILIVCNGNAQQATENKPMRKPVEINTFHSERIKDTFFENVIEITNNNVINTGIDYLFDISIASSTETPVLFISAKVPLELLPRIYPELPKLIVITPNWNYYEETSSQRLPKEIKCAEPMASSVIYEFNRENGKLQKDSLVIMGGKGFPEMKFTEKYKLKDNEVDIYYSEYYGSVCCPRDQQLDNKPTREEFITFFEKENAVKITDTYQEMIGEEGEVTYNYTLNGLTNSQKLKFILERDFYRIINRETKDIIKTPNIYTPYILKITNRIKKI